VLTTTVGGEGLEPDMITGILRNLFTRSLGMLVVGAGRSGFRAGYDERNLSDLSPAGVVIAEVAIERPLIAQGCHLREHRVDLVFG